MDRINFSEITACGENCTGCEKKKSGACRGCLEADGYVPEWAASGRCPVHACCRDHCVQFCGLCACFPCADLTKKVHWNPEIVSRQRELADRCGINYRVVNDVLTGRNRKEENIRRIRETLAIPS